MNARSKALQVFTRLNRLTAFVVWWLAAGAAIAGTTNSAIAPPVVPALTDAGVSLLRVTGALALVIGLFLGGVWLFKNWQRLAHKRGGAPKLEIIETRSLGGRQALYIVGCEQERFLVASSPAGISLLSHLPSAVESEAADTGKNPPAPSFAQALSQVLKGK
jgi:flagellar biogenesis protein FliO